MIHNWKIGVNVFMDRIIKNENIGKLARDLPSLLRKDKGVCVSLLMPLEREPDKFEKNRIRSKNIIKQAKEKLADEDFLPVTLSRSNIEQLFEPAQELLNGLRSERDHGRGLAIFLEQSTNHIYHLPIPFEEQIRIGPRFYIKPLLPLLNKNGRFYLLTLSQEKVQLWRGSPFHLEKINVPNLPTGMDEALALEDPEERALQFHTSTGQTGDRSAVHHGHEADTEKKGAILRYFREVNDAIIEGIAGQDAPLLLAAVDYLRPIYQNANTYSHLLADGISGNPDHWNVQELHERAWQTAEPHFKEAMKTVIDQYREVKDTEISSQSVDEIVPAAAYGRVDTLLISMDNGRQKWGRFNESSGKIEECEARSFLCDDLLNLAAIKTLQNGGTVYAVDPKEMPGETELAAIFRYAI